LPPLAGALIRASNWVTVMLTAFLSAKDAKEAKEAKEAKIADGRLDCMALAEHFISFRSSLRPLRPLRTNALSQLLATFLVGAGSTRDHDHLIAE
jgi:hypothetical protein